MLGIPLKEIVEDYMLEDERATKHKFPIYVKHAINAVKELHREVDGITKTKSLTLGRANTAPLPEDFIKLLRVFVVDSNGYITYLSENTAIYKGDDSCGNLISTPTQNGIGYSYLYSEHYRDGQDIGGYYGLGGGSTAGEYNINRGNGRMEFSSLFNASRVIIEYIGEPEPINGEFRVHPYLREAVKNYIQWKNVQRKTNSVSFGLIRALQDQYTDSMLQAKMNIFGEGLEDVVNATRINFRQIPNF